jgi:hypothetical protein
MNECLLESDGMGWVGVLTSGGGYDSTGRHNPKSRPSPIAARPLEEP